jgi:chromosome segregation ATPase
MRISSVLCFLLLTSNSHAAFWKKGEKSKRRRLTENTIPDNVEMDAATGTVTNPAAETKASQTCDGQMAQSLVKANEEMMKAQAELLDMKQEKAQDLKNILELTEVVEIATRDIQDMKAAQAFKIQDLETAYDDLKKKMTDELQEAIALKDQRIESLSESLEMSREELVSEYEDQLKAVEARRMEDETKLTASLSEALDNSHMALEKAAENLKETKSKHEEEIEGWKSALESANKEASETREDSLEKLKETHGQEIAKLRSELEDQKKAAGLTLEQYKDETKVLLLAQTEEKDKQIDAAMVQAKQAKESMKDQIMVRILFLSLILSLSCDDASLTFFFLYLVPSCTVIGIGSLEKQLCQSFVL